MFGTTVLDSRKNIINIIYEGVNITTDIARSLLNCSYKESTGELDSLEINLEDINNNWIGNWNPLKGDKIIIEYLNYNLNFPGDTLKKNKVGTFYVDTLEFSGPPDIVSIKALPLPLDSKLIDQSKVKVWENITLKKIVEEIATNASLELFYYVDTEREYKRIEQDGTDYDTLKKICEENGLNLKIYEDKLIIYEESKMEKKDPVITLHKDGLLSYYFRSTDTRAYSECVISYFDHVLNKKIEQKVTLKERKNYKGNPRRTLLLHEDKSPPGETPGQKREYLKTIAKKALKQKNKLNTTANISITGQSIWLSCGEIINLEGVGNFSGKYLITSIDVDLSNYKLDLELRKVNTDDEDSEEEVDNNEI